MENEKLKANSPAITIIPTSATTGSASTDVDVTGRPVVTMAGSAGQAGRLSENPPGAAPLSFGQRRLWLLDQLEPGSPLHHISQVVRLRGSLDAGALESSLTEIIARHESLRTTFVRHGSEPVQTPAKHWTFLLARTDVSTLDAGARGPVLERLAHEEAMRPFDLRTDLLLRARLVRMDETSHALILVLHHIAADDASMAVLYRELGTLYEAFSAGGISLLPDLPIQYADHVGWQRAVLHGDTLHRLVKFWREWMAGAPPLLALPSDRHRPPARSYRGGVCTMLLPPELVTKLHALGRAHRATLFMTLLAGFKTLLSRYTGQGDIVVGTPVAGRIRHSTAGLIGLFSNTMVLRTQFEDDATFLALLDRVRETTLAACEHQDLAFEKLVEELQPKRDPSFEPVCQVMFSLQEPPPASLKLAGLQTDIETVKTGAIRTDLNLNMIEEQAGLRVSAEYSLDLFDAGTIERLLGHFRTLLEAIAENPDQRISLLPMLTAQEHHRMLSDWNATAVEYPKNRYLHELFEEQVARTPDAVALVFNDRELSYAGLNRLADRLASRLRARGVGANTLVALCVERSLEMPVGLLGILKAGAAYVPLDPAFPAERLAFMLEDSGAPVLVTQHRLKDLFTGKAAVVCLDDDSDDDAFVPPAVAVARCPENLAYVLYTSGSTGRPKGVMVSHRNVINFFAGMDRTLTSGPGTWLAVTSISFDISVLELFWTLTRGFKVVILADQAGLKFSKAVRIAGKAGEETRSLEEQLVRHQVTHLQCTPSFARLLTRMPGTLAALRPLRYLVVGGEALAPELAGVLTRSIDGDLVNMYGPTETTVYSTVWKVEKSGPIFIGRPIANTQIYILDRNRQPVPAGVPGELYIGGDGLARGYWHRPELTAEKFVAHPFSTGARLYRTGDLARYMADGMIEFIGRADHQVKVGGHRIELGEIEAVIGQHPGVASNVVVVRTDNPEDPRLAAYVVAAPSWVPAATELRNLLREKLPHHMVPDFIVFMERLPLTPNGKTDRNALPPPTRNVVVKPADVSSLAGLELAIAAIWKDVLAVDHLNPDDNFFDSGGRSFQVVQVKGRLQESLGIEVPVIKLFQYPTIRSLADFIGTQKDDADALHSKIQERAQRRQNALVSRRLSTEEAKS